MGYKIAFMLVFVFTALVSTVVAQVTDCTLLAFTEQLGTLPDGTPYSAQAQRLTGTACSSPTISTIFPIAIAGWLLLARSRMIRALGRTNAIRCAPSGTTRRKDQKSPQRLSAV